MKIYLAGKISPSDWRGDILLDYRPGSRFQDEALDPWPLLKNAIFGEHDYTGPFFVSDDHGCGHTANGHGNAAGGCVTHCFEAPSRNFIAKECLRAIDRSDLVFAWFDDLTAFGTIAEIGYAIGRGKRVWIAYSPDKIQDIDASDLWLTTKIVLTSSAGNRVTQAKSPVLALLRLLAPENQRGVVYFIRRGNKGPIKIGTSVDPQQRIKQLQTAAAEKLELLGTVAGGTGLERSIHGLLSAFRMEGEWFKDDPRVLGLIDAVCQ